MQQLAVFIIMISLSTGICMGNEMPQANNTLPVSAKVQQFLGESLLEILQAPNHVESYLVEPKKKEAPNRLHDFPIIGKGPRLADSALLQFQTLVFDEKNYIWDYAKKCPFFPESGLRFVKGKEEAIVLLSMSCQQWVFVHKGETKLEDFDPAYLPILQLLQELFPKETRFRNLKSKEMNENRPENHSKP
ncbi:MAG: hypothetical protein HQM14_04455 [SAR324 cluster bacterium]|nr:hypothetical protein [SAR324 cluster bacterium]